MPSLQMNLEHPPSKKHKPAPTFPHADFNPGYIISVKITNFTTYSYAEFNLSPSLNMIIGPNGLGKLTLVAAICLGLGGKIDLIKRKSLKSMIKSGQSEALIEILLQNFPGKGPIRIKRTFTDRDSMYTMNHRACLEKAVRETCRLFNIQMDNLCHFLPQERVAEFATLSPEKLLLETERTLGDGQLLTLHESLIAKDQERFKLNIQIQDVAEKLEALSLERAKLELEAQKYNEYQEIVTKLENHSKLIPYAQMHDLKERQKHIKQQRDDCKANLLKFQIESKPVKEQLELALSTLGEAYSKLRSIEAQNKEAKSLFDNANSRVNILTDEIDLLKVGLKATINKSAEKKHELEQLTHEYDHLVKACDSLPLCDENEMATINELRDTKNDEIVVVKDVLEDLEQQVRKQNMIINNAQRRIEDTKRQLTSDDKLQLLKPYGKGQNQTQLSAYNAHVELRNAAELKDRFFEAPIVSCSVTDVSYARYIEQCIPNNDLFAITVSSKADFDAALPIVLDQHNAPIRHSNHMGVPQPAVSRERMLELGFDGYLLDFIKGPAPVLGMIFNSAKLDKIPVRKRPFTNDQINVLTKSGPNGRAVFDKFLAGDICFTVKQSRYGQKLTFYNSESINQPKYFSSTGISLDVRQEYQRNIEQCTIEADLANTERRTVREKANESHAKIKVLSRELEDIKHRREELVQKKKARASAEGQLHAKKKHLEQLRVDANKDYTEKIEDVKSKIKRKYLSSTEAMTQASGYASEVASLAIKANLQSFQKLQAQNREVSARKLLGFLETRKTELVEAYHQAKRVYDEIRKSDAAARIQEQSRNYTQQEKEELSELARQYMDAGTFSENFMRDQILLLQDQKSVMATADESSIQNLRQKLDEISRAEEDLPRMKAEKEKLDTRIENIRSNWEPELTELVKKISIAFNKRFTKVASDGQIDLAKNERFQDWKLQIMVKFRQELELKVLDHQSQLGGERAVLTIFFIMSLQGLTDAPFRVVDEINQGMDPKNEKQTHRYLVHTACTNNKSQYFLVTPKLLTGLYYHPQMMVHCIYTGPLIGPVEKDETKVDFMDFARQSIVA